MKTLWKHFLCCSLAVAGALTSACDPAPDPSLAETSAASLSSGGGITLPPIDWIDHSPRLDEVWGKSSHNSYHMNRDHRLDAFADGGSEVLSDQLLHEHVSMLELDIRGDGASGGDFSVQHTDRPDFSQCNPLSDCLEMLRAFHYAQPEHDPIVVLLEIKTNPILVWSNAFYPGHTAADLDALLRARLGSSLYTPADFMAGYSGTTLEDVLLQRQWQDLANGGWPRLSQLRGKFIFTVSGSWNRSYNDWLGYAGVSDIRQRAAFPNRSIFDNSGGGIDSRGNNQEPIDQAQEQQARANSIIWGVEATRDPASRLYPDGYWIWDNARARHVLGRGWQGDGVDCAAHDPIFGLCTEPHDLGVVTAHVQQQTPIAQGLNWFQSDNSWNTFEDKGPDGWPAGLPAGLPTDPSRRYRDPAPLRNTGSTIPPDKLIERGIKIYVHAPGSITPTFGELSYATVPAGTERFWETTVSTTRYQDTFGGINRPRIAQEDSYGCLKAASSVQDYAMICRYKRGDALDSNFQEEVDVEVWSVHGGMATQHQRFPASVYHSDSIGNLIAMDVDNRGVGSRVKLYSAGTIGADGRPAWRELVNDHFAAPLDQQGLVTVGDVLYAGVRWQEPGQAWHALDRCQLARTDRRAGSYAELPKVFNLSNPRIYDDACAPQVALLPYATPSASAGMSIIQASYGPVAGNATADVAAHCDGKLECAYKVDVTRLGDPAPGVTKPFTVRYRCGTQEKLGFLPAEADLNSVHLSCPAPTPAFVHGDAFGGQGGVDFDDTGSANRVIGVRVRRGSGIDRVTTIFRSPSGVVSEISHGGSGGDDAATFWLNEGEVIVGVVGRAGSTVDGLQLLTSTGRRSEWYGGSGGTPFESYLDPRYAFAGFAGRAGGAVDQLALVGAPSSPPGIQVVDATYGPLFDDASWDVAAQCNGKYDCSYQVDVGRLGDPASGVAKAFTVHYRCTALEKSVVVPAEANLNWVSLSCPTP